MHSKLRAQGEPHMTKASYERFTRPYLENRLVKPEDCGHVIAALALKAPKHLSGQFVSWDSDDCKPFRREQI